MAWWRFFDYITEEDHNLVVEWYDSQDPEVQAQFDVTLNLLGGIADWEAEDVEWFKKLTKQHVGLGEVIFHIEEKQPGARKARRRRFRPVGIWPSASEHEFVMILGCEKTRVAYIPEKAFDIALIHKANLEAGKGHTCEHV
jgi:hypothetical protein